MENHAGNQQRARGRENDAGRANSTVSADRYARAMRYRARAVMPKPVNGKALLDALVRESSLFG